MVRAKGIYEEDLRRLKNLVDVKKKLEPTPEVSKNMIVGPLDASVRYISRMCGIDANPEPESVSHALACATDVRILRDQGQLPSAHIDRTRLKVRDIKKSGIIVDRMLVLGAIYHIEMFLYTHGNAKLLPKIETERHNLRRFILHEAKKEQARELKRIDEEG
ncbi:hypothetical protein F53441_12667 [Fusarium austroafricanum]|uniref:Uncharacterized protein n=1 Tax=Fusarium austroafricanum TaxID=2364996 RepID=A0A8H4JW91_9HYPO|nr:hypothetical protein F53441_12667 [Fusarium austroafricanum]